MDLWKPAVRKTKKVSGSSGITSTTTTNTSAAEDKLVATLPDVVAHLSLSHPPQQPPPTSTIHLYQHLVDPSATTITHQHCELVDPSSLLANSHQYHQLSSSQLSSHQHHLGEAVAAAPTTSHQQVSVSTMLGTRDHHHYHDMGDSGRTARRREARPPPPPVTPQGLGAAPQGLGAAPSPPLVAGANVAGGSTSGGWRHNPQHLWSSQAPQDPPTSTGMGMAVGMSAGGGSSGVCGESDGARVRSISSEPRGPAANGGDRRVRCSSASRSRQHRPRPPPGDRPPGSTAQPQLSSVPLAGGGHGGQQPYPPAGGGAAQCGGGVGVVGGVLARLAGCHENLECGRESGEGVAYGYQVSDLEALLTRASPSRPANLPMVLASATRLHNMRRTPEPRPPNHPPVRPFLPLGIIVNAVFKTRDWLYVRTAHGAEGYVPYRVCLPLGILPPPRDCPSATTATDAGGVGAWESRTDVFQGTINAQMPGTLGVPTVQTTTGGMGVVSSEGGTQTRGRPRGRRRPVCPDSSNQTDTQKLQPAARSLSESRPPRETLDPPPVAPTPVAPTPLAPPAAPTPTADHILV